MPKTQRHLYDSGTREVEFFDNLAADIAHANFSGGNQHRLATKVEQKTVDMSRIRRLQGKITQDLNKDIIQAEPVNLSRRDTISVNKGKTRESIGPPSSPRGILPTQGQNGLAACRYSMNWTGWRCSRGRVVWRVTACWLVLARCSFTPEASLNYTVHRRGEKSYDNNTLPPPQ